MKPSVRDKLKKTKQPECDLGAIETPPWAELGYTGDDVPLEWDPPTRQQSKKYLRANFKCGYITKKQYKQQLREL